MPTYVYGCDICGHRFEKVQRFSDEPIKVCPECAGIVRRIFQPAGIVFKGSGWHTTDYKRNGKAESESTKAESSSGGESSAKDKDATAKGGTKESPAKEAPAKSGGTDTAPASPA